MPAQIVQAEPRETCQIVRIAGLGDACERDNGLFQVEADEGTDLLVHGHDYLANEGTPVQVDAGRAPVCAPAGTHRMIVVYARPNDTSSRYGERVDSIRGLVRDANATLHSEAMTEGATADYRVACDGDGAITVRHESLPTKAALDSFSTVVSDLRAKGYTSILEKVWVWYEGSIGSGIAGTGHLYWDESRDVNNRNNAGSGTASTFGVTWGAVAGYSVRTWMHENAHNLGAVQQNAPDSTGNAHCTDGQDIMCYADGGAPYNPNVCTDRQHFDCGHDTYFDPDPASGSYLAEHWNIGWHRNRFVDLKPTAELISSSESVVEGSPATFSVRRRGVIDIDLTLSWNLVPGTLDAADAPMSGTISFGSGQRLATLTIPTTDDDLVEATETAALRITGDALGRPVESGTLSVADNDTTGGGATPDPEPNPEPVGPLPDIAIATKDAGPYRAEDAISATGAGQVKGRSARRGQRAPFVVRSSNDGDAVQDFRFRVDAYKGFRVVVRDAATGEWLLGTTSSRRIRYALAPGEERSFRVEVRVKRHAQRGVRRATRLLLRPIGIETTDVAFANVRVR